MEKKRANKNWNYKKMFFLYFSSLFCYFFVPPQDLSYTSHYYTVEDEENHMKIGYKNLWFSHHIQTIETENEAFERGYLEPNPTFERLIKAVDENKNIPYKMKDYFYYYIKGLYKDGKTNIKNSSILLKNIELLDGVYSMPQNFIKAISGSSQTVGCFLSSYNEHFICLSKERESYHQYILNHEFNHMRKTLLFQDTETNTIINISFAKEAGYSLDEELNSYYTSLSFVEFGGYPYENMYLLENILTEQELENIYFYGNIDTLQYKLEEINSSINFERFIQCSDLQVDYIFDNDPSNDYDIDYELYSIYIDYFFSKEKQNDYQDFSNNFNDFCDVIIHDIPTSRDIKEQLLQDLKKERVKILEKRK